MTATPPTTGTQTSGSILPRKQPNIVFILVDDMSMNLLKYLPRVQKMQREGTTFSKYYVTDSLCCPSRASILTGRYPHNTGVFTNTGPDGGYNVFLARNQEADTFATDLQGSGYRTALMGKFMNQYRPGSVRNPNPVPQGWTEWGVGGSHIYKGFDYTLNQNGKVRRYGDKRKDYLTDVLADRGVDFIARSVKKNKPFILELATVAPHSPYTPAPRDKKKFPGLKAPRNAAYNQATTNAPFWLAARQPLNARAVKAMDEKFRKRAQSMLAIDAMIGRVQAELVAQGVADDTYLFFSSDNGFHLGEHRLLAGKQTAFDHDIHVPLVVTGPGVPAGRIVDELAENIDLRPTFAALAGSPASPAVDGRDLSSMLHGGSPAESRDAILVEHKEEDFAPEDPDAQPGASGNPPTYAALRGRDWLYVEYITGEREYYDTAADPHQLTNVVATLPVERQAQLRATLMKVQTCVGTARCWEAQRM